MKGDSPRGMMELTQGCALGVETVSNSSGRTGHPLDDKTSLPHPHCVIPHSTTECYSEPFLQ